MNTIQRLNYFTSQFLVENDFQDEQSYHRSMRLRHNQHLHTPGVVDGLQVSQVPNTTNQIKVSAGMAIDQNGQEIVLLTDSAPVILSGNNTDVFVTLKYTEVLDERDTTSGLTDKFRRTVEKYEITGDTQLSSDARVVLARVTLKGNSIDKVNNDIPERTSAGATIAPQSISTAQIQDGAVTTAKIAPNAISAAQIQNGAVTNAKIAPNSISDAQLQSGAVTTANIARNAISEAQIQNGAVTNTKIALNSINTTQIQNNAVTIDKMAPNSINTGQLVDNSVTAAKIADGSVGRAELATGAVTADKMALNAFVVRSLSFGNTNLPFYSLIFNNPTKLAGIRISFPSAGVIIVTASGSYSTVSVPGGWGIALSFGLQPANSASSIQMPDDAINIIYKAPITMISGPFSITKAFPVTQPGTQIYNLVGSLNSPDRDVNANGLDMARLNLTAMFVPCSTDIAGEGPG